MQKQRLQDELYLVELGASLMQGRLCRQVCITRARVRGRCSGQVSAILLGLPRGQEGRVDVPVLPCLQSPHTPLRLHF